MTPIAIARQSKAQRRRWATVRRGVATVEAAVTLPLVATLLIGVLEVGRMLDAQVILENAVREGSRQAAGGLYTNSQVQQVVLNYMIGAGLSTSGAAVTVSDVTTPGTDCSAANENDELQITVTVPFSSIQWCSAHLVTNSSSQLSASAIWFSARNQAYPGSVSAPSGY
jgi:Flp pilus assembly protein TadG